MKPGRNDPCPCGSGKKYKRCCIGSEFVSGREMELRAPRAPVLVDGVGDYGAPKVDDDFFEKNPFREWSAPRLFYSTLVEPRVARLAAEVAKLHISRGRREEERIRETDDVAGLVALLKQEPDPLNHRLLADKLVQLGEVAAPLLARELGRAQNDCFVELAVQIIYESKVDCSAALLKIAEEVPAIDAYALSLICLLLGMTGPGEVVKPLWDCFHFFAEKYPGENFSQGPLIGLWELARRMAEDPDARATGG